MPVIKFAYKDLEDLIKRKIDHDELINLLPMIGSDIEDYDNEEIKVEFFPNRPDYLSVEGVARTLKGVMGIEQGIPYYPLESSQTSILVDEELADIRPYIACCCILGINLTEDKLRQLMDFQEDLHWVMGRDRKKVAIGIHNLDVLQQPFRYLAANPDKMSFVPLEMNEERTLRQILKEHKKGRYYAHIIDKYDKYPLIVDSNNQVLSMPPIINGELTKLTLETRNVLIDVTGTNKLAVDRTLNIISASFAESGAKIRTMKIVYPDETVERPDLTPKEHQINVNNAQRIIGVSLKKDQVVNALHSVRLDAEALNENIIKVMVPPYRVDILHEVDIIENIAVGYGFNKILPELPRVATIAKEDTFHSIDHVLREIMIGMGFMEVMSLMLTNEEQHYQKMLLPEQERIEVSQPISQDRTMIRQSLLNGLLEFLEDNKHEELPQKLFEVGETVFLDGERETKTRGVKKLAVIVTHSQANFTEIKSISNALINNLGMLMKIEDLNHPSFINGRCAKLKGVKKDNDEIEVEGFFGEMNPEVINNFQLEYPAVALEIKINNI